LSCTFPNLPGKGNIVMLKRLTETVNYSWRTRTAILLTVIFWAVAANVANSLFLPECSLEFAGVGTMIATFGLERWFILAEHRLKKSMGVCTRA